MSDRITPAMVTGSTLNDINASLATMERTSSELSSGKTILEPSENPYGASQVIDLQSELEGLKSYEANAQDGISWENTASSAMANISEVVQRSDGQRDRTADRSHQAGRRHAVRQPVRLLRHRHHHSPLRTGRR
jgi:hypothetical protein